MHDIRALRADPAAFDADLARRGLEPVAQKLLSWDEERRQAQTALQEKQGRRKALAREIGPLKRNGEDTTALEAEAVALRTDMEALEAQVAALEGQSTALLETLPNRLDPSVPEGPDETANVVQHQWGTLPTFSFTPRQHFELGEALGLMDFGTAAKLSGARFVVLRGALARLARALGQFMLDLHSDEHGYI